MRAALDMPAMLLAELTALGIELQAHGDRLRFRPKSPMTAELLARVKAHKAGLLALLGVTFPGAELVSVQRAPERPPADAAAWPAPDVLAHLPRAVAELARRRDGWTPATWRGRLLYLAAACAALHPDQAAELRRAAAVIGPVAEVRHGFDGL